MQGHRLTIAQFSDIHCGHVMFDADLMESAIDEIVQLQPDLVVMAAGAHEATVWTCDLSAEYVRINGEYRT